MIDVHPSPSPGHTPTNLTAPSPETSGLGWPTSMATETSIDVSRETSMIPAGLGWPE
jgi:hypothetical protein